MTPEAATLRRQTEQVKRRQKNRDREKADGVTGYKEGKPDGICLYRNATKVALGYLKSRKERKSKAVAVAGFNKNILYRKEDKKIK